jgi:hypothetical protein
MRIRVCYSKVEMKNLFEKLNISYGYTEAASAMHWQDERKLQERVLVELLERYL